MRGDATRGFGLPAALAGALFLLASLSLAAAQPGPAAPAAGRPAPAAEAGADAKPAAGPAKVTVGAFINDIQDIDFKTNSYTVDLYVWFRWTDKKVRPDESMEFMNRYAPYDSERDSLYDEPQPMPDGTSYAIIRMQGQFSKKFNLADYPFDTQFLDVDLEDTIFSARQLVYQEGAEGVTLNPDITLPGFKVGKPVMRIRDHRYPTYFGDISMPDATSYSRVTLSIPVTRPIVAMSVKNFVPVVLIVVCAGFVFFVRPSYVEGRIGLGITALLTLVATQLAATASLPDVDYLTLLDKVYLIAYLFIIVALARIVATSWRGHDEAHHAAITRVDRISVTVLFITYFMANALVAYFTIHG